MSMVVRSIAIMLGVAASVGIAHAQSDVVASSRQAILAGDMTGAEHTLDAERRIYPDRQEVLLNLAAIYANSGRLREAAALYGRVLQRRDALMDVDGNRTASAHAIANRGLSRITSVQTASR